jgi:hypothetical protein
MNQLQILLLASFFVLASINNASAKKFATAELHLLSGEKIDCFVQMPIYVRNSDKIYYKLDLEGKKQKIKSDEIDLMVLKSGFSNYTLKWTKYFKNGTDKISRNPVWCEVRSVCPEIITYAIAKKYEKTNNGSVISYYEQGIGEHLMQRPGEEYPCTVGYVFIQKSIMKKRADKKRKKILSLYFSEDKEMLKWLESKKRVDQFELQKQLQTLCKKEDNE